MKRPYLPLLVVILVMGALVPSFAQGRAKLRNYDLRGLDEPRRHREPLILPDGGLYNWGFDDVLSPVIPQPRPAVIKAGSKTAKITIQDWPNAQIRSYQPDQTLSTMRHLVDFQWPLDRTRDYLKIGPLGRKLVSTLFRIPGVCSVNLEPNKVDVEIGNAFSWSKLEPQVLEVMGNVLLRGNATITYAQPKELRLISETAPNKQVRGFHVNRVLSQGQLTMFMAPFDEEVWWDDLEEVGDLGKSLVRQVMQIGAVETMFLHPYSVQVVLRDNNTWTPQLEQKVKDIITTTIKGKRVPPATPKTSGRGIRT